MPKMTGSCLCGKVQYRVTGPLRPVCYCHCDQCRKSSGHFVATTQCIKTDIVIEGDVKWYESSSTARRGFCSTCGSQLFWELSAGSYLSIHAGSLDGTTREIRVRDQLWSSSKGEYYTLPDVPTIEQSTLKR